MKWIYVTLTIVVEFFITTILAFWSGWSFVNVSIFLAPLMLLVVLAFSGSDGSGRRAQMSHMIDMHVQATTQYRVNDEGSRTRFTMNPVVWGSLLYLLITVILVTWYIVR